jgi:hypothetical protein
MSAILAIAFLAVGPLITAAKDRKSASDEAMTFTVIDKPRCDSCVVLLAKGDVSEATISRFQEALDKLEKTTTWSRDKARSGGGPQLIVLLDSGGGLVGPAFSVSRQLRTNGAITAVARPSVTFATDGALDPSKCNSACGFILIGGKIRFSHLLSNIGLHQLRPIVEEKRRFTHKEVLYYLSDFEEATADLARHLTEMTMDPKLLLYMMQTAGDAMTFVSTSEAKSLGIINTQADSLDAILNYRS